MPYSSLIRTITALYNLNNLVKTTRKLVKKKSQTTNFLVNLFLQCKYFLERILNENSFQYMIPYQKIFDCLYKQVFEQAL
jgi:hypothetical protein